MFQIRLKGIHPSNLFNTIQLNFSEIPPLSRSIIFCGERVLADVQTLKQLLRTNDRLRLSFDMVLLNLARPLLRKLELAFKPGLTRLQWTSQDLRMYFTYVQEVKNMQLKTFLDELINALIYPEAFQITSLCDC